MEEHLSPLAVTHLLQHTLRSMCIHENSEWVYAVFWRILPRNYPPPKWDAQGAYDRSRGNRRNWILVWEDGFCNFAASSSDCQGLQPELFFKMSHEIYNYGEGQVINFNQLTFLFFSSSSIKSYAPLHHSLIGKVAADRSHKWIYKEPNDQVINLLSSWHNSADTQPRTWEAQFQNGIKTIALIAVREGVVQLGATHKVVEDLSSVVFLRKKFNYIESIPGVLLPHPSSSSLYPFKVDVFGGSDIWQFPGGVANPPADTTLLYDHSNHQLRITPSMSSLEALLSKLPSVVPPSSQSPSQFLAAQQRPLEFISMEKLAKEEIEEEFYGPETSSSSMPAYRYQNAHSNTTNNDEEF